MRWSKEEQSGSAIIQSDSQINDVGSASIIYGDSDAGRKQDFGTNDKLFIMCR